MKSRNEIKDKHFKSKCHEFFDQFTITRYFVGNPNINVLSEIMKKSVDIRQKSSFVFEKDVRLK